MKMFKIKFSNNMKKQRGISPSLTFSTREKALSYGTSTYGSGSYDKKYGWYIVEIDISATIPDFMDISDSTAFYGGLD